MKKKIVKFSVLPVLAASVFYSFSTKEAVKIEESLHTERTISNHNVCYTVPEAPEFFDETNVVKMYPKLGKSYVAFKEALGFAESSSNYGAVNDFGYLGKYQFGRSTLKMLGINNPQFFLNTPKLQEAAFYANAARNKWLLRRYISQFENKTIDGIKITESGILAAAHLAGAGNVRRYLRSWGTNGFRDGFGTSIVYYFKEFAGYDTSFVKPNRTAQAQGKS